MLVRFDGISSGLDIKIKVVSWTPNDKKVNSSKAATSLAYTVSQ